MIIENKNKAMPIFIIPEIVLERIREVMQSGFGELVIKIQNNKVVHVDRTMGERL